MNIQPEKDVVLETIADAGWHAVLQTHAYDEVYVKKLSVLEILAQSEKNISRYPFLQLVTGEDEQEHFIHNPRCSHQFYTLFRRNPSRGCEDCNE